MKKFNKKNITAILIELQNYGGIEANAFATKTIKEFGLRKEHQKQTGNPDSAYKLQQ